MFVRPQTTDAPSATGSYPALSLGRVPLVAVGVGVGLLLCAVADALSRATLAPSPWIYWAGVALIAAPILYRLCGAETSTAERLALVCMLGLSLYVVKLMRDPFGFTLSDEFPHAYNVDQILRHHRLFSSNPILPVTSDYPGLEGATSAIASMTGLSSFGAGIILIGAARLTLTVALFGLFAGISRSSRIGGLAAAIYAGNSNYLLWGAQFSYESLALPLLVFVLACIAERHAGRRSDVRAWGVPIVLGIAAIVPTHHLTSYLLAVILILLATTRRLKARFSPTPGLGAFAAVAVGLTVAWLLVVASRTVGYLSPVVTAAVKSTIQTISGEVPPHALFSNSGVAAGQSNQLGEEIIGIAAILILFVGLPSGLRAVWRGHRRQALAVLLGLGAVGYFGVTGLRFVPSAWEIANRSAEFLFIGLAFVVAFAPLHRVAIRGRLWAGRAVLAACGAAIIVGGAITGWPANSRLAQPTRITANGSQLESQTLSLGHWVADLPGGTFVAPDADADTIALYGDRHVLTGTDADADDILARPTLQAWELALWRKDHIRYVVVDLRKRSYDNTTGFYFDVHPPGGVADQLLPRTVASRFDELSVPRIFDSGDVLIYDLNSAS